MTSSLARVRPCKAGGRRCAKILGKFLTPNCVCYQAAETQGRRVKLCSWEGNSRLWETSGIPMPPTHNTQALAHCWLRTQKLQTLRKSGRTLPLLCTTETEPGSPVTGRRVNNLGQVGSAHG